MKKFSIVRRDIYVVEVEARTEEEAWEKLNKDDACLNDGTFIECEFDENTLSEV